VINQFFTFSSTIERLRQGPLSEHLDAYAASIAAQGYGRHSIREQIVVIADFSRGVSFAQIIVELNLFLVGWLTYYRFAACRFELQCMDEWIRRKLRCYRLKQCKRGKSMAGFLKKLGASPSLAHRVASSGKGWWRLSLSRPSHQAMSADWFATQGLQSLVLARLRALVP
jgi:hypothetical protein